MPLPLAARMHDIQPFHVMELLRRAHELEAQGRDIIHMEVGEPDFPTPQPVIEAALRFTHGGRVAYTPAMGLPALREAISAFYRTRFAAEVPASRIVITPGASGALMLALALTTDPGDEWLIPDPSYPCNRHLVRSFEGRNRALPVTAESRYQPTAAQVEHAWSAHTRGLMVATPSNPTGTLLGPDELLALNHTCRRHNGVLIVDEIYQGLTYGVESSSALALFDDAFVINSFSKYFGMTGWRLGWLVVPAGYEREVEKLSQHFFIAASTPAQHAALAAFEPDTLAILEQRRTAFAERRAALLPALRELGFVLHTEPQGAFYLYADISGLASDAETLARRLIEEAGVATTPGLDFGQYRATQHLRLAYTTDTPRLLEACQRIAGMLAQP